MAVALAGSLRVGGDLSQDVRALGGILERPEVIARLDLYERVAIPATLSRSVHPEEISLAVLLADERVATGRNVVRGSLGRRGALRLRHFQQRLDGLGSHILRDLSDHVVGQRGQVALRAEAGDEAKLLGGGGCVAHRQYSTPWEGVCQGLIERYFLDL